MVDKKNNELSSGELLAGLRSSESSKAWKQFLDTYSPTIKHIASQYEHDRDRLSDCYLFICDGLSDNSFHRLLSYQPEGSANFRSWLKVVIANLCIDWHRLQYGRPRPFKSISRLSSYDQLVFKYRFQQRMSFSVCLETLLPQFPDLNEVQLAGAVNRINTMLTPSQHRHLEMQHATTVSLSHTESGRYTFEPDEPAPDPEKSAIMKQDQDKLQQALTSLSSHHRLLIRLRYQQELSLK